MHGVSFPSNIYMNIWLRSCRDTWQNMWRYLAIYLHILEMGAKPLCDAV